MTRNKPNPFSSEPLTTAELILRLKSDLQQADPVLEESLTPILAAAEGLVESRPADERLAAFAYQGALLYADGRKVPLCRQTARALQQLAVQLGCFEAAVAEAHQVLQGASDEAAQGAIEVAFRLGQGELRKRLGTGRHQVVEALIDLFRRYASFDRKQVLVWVADLLALVTELDIYPGGSAEPVFNPLYDHLNVSTLRVAEPISPSGDRVTKELLKRFEVLATQPMPLAPLPPLDQINQALQAEFPWMASVTRWVLQHLTARAQGHGYFHLPPVLILGPPGVGKTAFWNRLGDLCGVPFQALSLAGSSDNRDLFGTARGWSSGQPGAPVRLIVETGTANPLVLLDELDKVSPNDRNGNVWNTLLSLFESESSGRYYDEFLQTRVNLSAISWIATANSVAGLPSALLSRLEVIRVEGPTEPAHYRAIVQRTMDRFQTRFGIPRALMPQLGPAEWRWLHQYFTSPRLARRATEKLMTVLLTQPAPGQRLH